MICAEEEYFISLIVGGRVDSALSAERYYDEAPGKVTTIARMRKILYTNYGH
jgi:hypothetical protein